MVRCANSLEEAGTDVGLPFELQTCPESCKKGDGTDKLQKQRHDTQTSCTASSPVRDVCKQESDWVHQCASSEPIVDWYKDKQVGESDDASHRDGRHEYTIRRYCSMGIGCEYKFATLDKNGLCRTSRVSIIMGARHVYTCTTL
jgi:hypothetical protein